MQKPHIERRDLLALLALGLVPAPERTTRSAELPWPRDPSPQGRIQVYARHGSEAPRSMHTAGLAEVRQVLRAGLNAPGEQSPTERVRELLQRAFGDRVSESVLAPQYVWVWVGDRWVWMCLASSTFDVDFGARGMIAVEVEEGMQQH